MTYQQRARLHFHIYMQSLIYFVCGLWPVLNIHSFMAVTGPKTDIWLVHAVGLLLAGIAVSLFIAARKNQVTRSTMLLGVLSPLALLLIDLVYVFNDTISAIYLWDAFLQMILILGWLLLYKKPDT